MTINQGWSDNMDYVNRQNHFGGAPVDPAAADMAAARKRIRDLTEGRATDLANDPYQRSVMDFLQGVTNGKNVPFTNEVQGAMLAQQGKGTADAEAAQMANMRESLAASGGSIYDPSYQAAAREAMAARQGQNLDNAGRMAAQAGIANFNAQMGGATSLANARNAQNAQINQLGLAGAGYQAMETREVGGGGYGGSTGGGGGARLQPTMPMPSGSAIESQPNYVAPGTMVRGGGGQAGVVYGSGTPTQAAPVPTAPGSYIIPENDPQTDAEKKRAGSYRLADIKAGTGPYAPSTPSRY